MLPTSNQWSVSADETMLEPDNSVINYRVDKEKGGVDISDPSEKINGYSWESSYSSTTGDIKLRNVDTDTESVILNVPDISQINFAFDTNMRPFITWQKNDGTVQFYWYDSLIEDFTTTTLPNGTRTPRCCHDDKADFFTPLNVTDVLLFYIRPDNTLVYRQQRDRYGTEYTIATVTEDARLFRVGMGTNRKIKIVFETGSATI